MGAGLGVPDSTRRVEVEASKTKVSVAEQVTFHLYCFAGNYNSYIFLQVNLSFLKS